MVFTSGIISINVTNVLVQFISVRITLKFVTF